jgi:hypothetical protein
MSIDHLGGFIPEGDRATWMPDIWGYLALTYDIKSVIDIGAGYGHNIKWWHDLGFEAVGVEGHPVALQESPCKDILVSHDYERGPYVPEREFDLCICTEFVEHVDQKCEGNWFATMQKCRYVLMCHAVPGQGGHHHVNEQTTDYWIDRFAEQGFKCDWLTSLKFRETNNRQGSGWGRPTLLFFVRES